MIQANELRIGNTITHHNNNGIYLVTVLETLKNGINVKTNLQLGECLLRYEEVQGTPLTEEWLLKLGFNKGHNEWWIDLNGIDQQIEIMESGGFWWPRLVQSPEFSNEDCQIISLNRISYIHQLQNLYFALTGKELSCTP